MKTILYTLLLCTSILACTHYPTGVEETLSQAGSNRKELEKVLQHYRKDSNDSLKYRAACFLIDNMKWHLSTDRIIFSDSSLFEWHTRFDSLYANMMTKIPDSALYDNHNREKHWQYTYAARQLSSVFPPDTPTIINGIFPDPKHISSAFLISHIENSFYVWQTSPHASFLLFEQFKEMILPYRATTGYSFFENGQKLHAMFCKHLSRSDEKSYYRYISRYKHYKNNIHQMFPNYKNLPHVGLYDLFIGQNYDCISIADNFCHVFRAYGIPTFVDYNLSFREKSGRHFHCTLIDSSGRLVKYNHSLKNAINVHQVSASPSFFRNTFGAQADSPFMLKAEGETLPDYFTTPCIREVTDENYRVTPLELPINKELSNNLVYLYTFNASQGLVPATWGTVDHQHQKARFKNVVYNVLYFPVYLKGDSIIPFNTPFYISSPDTRYTTASLIPLCPEQTEKRGELFLQRKFPEKIHLQQQAHNMIGGRFEAANQEDFKDSVLLATIKTAPILNLQELTPNICQPFRYYRYVAPNSFPTSNMGLLEFLTDEHQPEDSLRPATPLPVFSPDEINHNQPNKPYYKLQVDKMKYHDLQYNYAYTTNMQYSSYMKIDLMPVKRPMKVKKIRFAPANAENHIISGHTYQLMYWDNGWKNAGTRLARYNFLQFNNVPLDRIYWLRDLTTGKEEHPFLYKNGKQLFIYHDTIVPQAQEFYLARYYY